MVGNHYRKRAKTAEGTRTMTATSVPASATPAADHRAAVSAGHRVSDSASDLVKTVAALSADDPSRPALREQAIKAWLPLAQLLAHRYIGRGEPTDDLTQTATIGLIKAVDKFDPDRGVDFAGYAIPTIIGEIKRHFRDRTWSVRPPRHLQERCLAIIESSSTLTQTLGRSPTVADLAADLGVTQQEILEGVEGARAYTATSLSAPIGADGTTELGETIGGTDHDMGLAELRVALGAVLAGLDTRAQTILWLRFVENLTQSEIGEKVGLSQMHISRLIIRAQATVREQLNAG
jgi:RNA polymerase sigma-B factor